MDRKKRQASLVDLIVADKGYDRITYGTRNVSILTLFRTNHNYDIDYPICGDTIAKMKEDRKL